ncbi:FAD-binding oxidoreductase [Deinococcus cellulosilyticus]|uniref:D-lactate dehydrogenase (cytochrome) n=1 Tax=Deinococcus cellulosilyticus (strain DSM 18568 / NBRC 106333 / KACC 11606 / 5516J-15) TaxID=1223518 RepID=A0A511NAM8_DEIC1|nr:FAD-linked oxidase C-terminal domain-containing protein [Deinococcus cellulosilyticus]GEM49860.1 oxidoreductase [Deinococcus cellulosilyticus NBRC 106333 = KACC 11606]
MHFEALDTLKALFSNQMSVAPSVLESHSRDESYPESHLPDVVVFAESEADVLKVLEVARTHQVPVVPFAVGSSIEGQVVPVHGGISLDLSRMNRVLQIHQSDFSAVVQPGVLYPELSRQARPYGLFFAVDPGADASLGGMASTNASGTGAVKYGTMRDQVLDMRVALISGEVIRVGAKSRKTSAGYDLRHLFIGAEGTLGVITELTVKLHPLPVAVAVAKVTFESVQDAVNCAVTVMGAGLSPERIELVDARAVQAVNQYKGTHHPETPTLWIELSASGEVLLRENLEILRECCMESYATSFILAREESERRELWESRHHAFYALKRLHPEHDSHTTDLCVPISRLPEVVQHTEELCKAHGLDAVLLGHVGDGNYHVLFHGDAKNPAQWESILQVSDLMVQKALEVGGTCTGEHGIGLRKRKHLTQEHGDLIPFMRGIKHLFDPQNLLNPGKIF